MQGSHKRRLVEAELLISLCGKFILAPRRIKEVH